MGETNRGRVEGWKVVAEAVFDGLRHCFLFEVHALGTAGVVACVRADVGLHGSVRVRMCVCIHDHV